MEAVVVLKPQDARNWLFLGQLYRKDGQWNQAYSAFQKTLDYDNKEAGAYAGMGNLQLDRQDYASALDLFNRAIDMQSANLEAWFGAALALHYLERTDEEIAAYQKVLAIDPTQVGALQNMGNAYLSQKKPESAVVCYLKAIELSPDNVDLHFNLGAAYANLKNYEKAIEVFQKTVALKPTNGPAYNELAICYYMRGDKKNARVHALKAQQLGEDVQKELLKN